MRFKIASVLLASLALAVSSQTSFAGGRVDIGVGLNIPGLSLNVFSGSGGHGHGRTDVAVVATNCVPAPRFYAPPVCVTPAVVYAPQPVVCAPAVVPVVYAPVYAPAFIPYSYSTFFFDFRSGRSFRSFNGGFGRR